MNLSTLRLISLQEQESGKFSEICDSTFDRVKEEIEYRINSDKKEDYISCEEIESYKTVIEDIFLERVRKMVQLILIDTVSGKCSTDSEKEADNLLAFEKTAYEQMGQIFINLRGQYLDDHAMELAIYKKKIENLGKGRCESCTEEETQSAP